MLTHRGEKPQDLMNHLLVACFDDQFSLLATAVALPLDQRERLHDLARRRGAFERELGAHIRRLGGAPARHGSVRPHVRAVVQRVNRALVGSTTGDAYRALAASEARTEALYAEVLRHALPPHARVTIERQHEEIALDQSDFRRRQWDGPGHALATPSPSAAPAPSAKTTPPARRPGHLPQWADDGGWQPESQDDE